MSSNRHTEEEFQSLLRRLDLALAASEIGVWEHNLRTDFVIWDQRMHRLYGTGLNTITLPAEIWAQSLHPDDMQRATAEFEAAIKTMGSYESQFRIIWPNGETRHLRSKATFYLTAEGDPAFIGMEWDVTADVLLNRELKMQRKIAEERAAALQSSQEQVEYAADHDYLTGLRNRRSFDRYCQTVAADDSISSLAMMHIDLDRFKEINDVHGHEAGDAILRVVAAAIQEARQQGDFAARMGGDEFILMAANFGSEDALRQRAQSIMEGMARGTEFRGEHIAIGASIGIAWNTRRDVPLLLKESDQALYEAKRQGRGRISFFTTEIGERTSGCQRYQEEFKAAIGTDAIRPHYQTVVDAGTGEISGLEAHLRWHHPTRGTLGAEEILPLARESGQIDALERHILDCVLVDLGRWRQQGKTVPTIWLGMSEERLSASGLIEELHRRHIPNWQIGFEVCMTSALSRDDGVPLAHLRAMRKLGFGIAACRIGADETSFLSLMRARPDRIKIGAELISPLPATQEQLQLLNGLVKFAHSLDIRVTAEGVQSTDQATVLKNLRFDHMQGPEFGLPQPYEQVPLNFVILKRDLKG